MTTPDVVGDWEDTCDLYEIWADELVKRHLPIGYVLQDGQPPEWMPWDGFDALFIGGTTEWKMGTQAAQFAREAKARGKWVHMGRVNGHQRIRYAKAIGCDSVDGTSMSWFRDTYLREFLRHAAGPTQEMMA